MTKASTNKQWTKNICHFGCAHSALPVRIDLSETVATGSKLYNLHEGLNAVLLDHIRFT